MDTSTQSNLQTGGTSTDFMKAIQDKLLGQSGVISSTNSTLETRINDAIAGVKTAAEKTNLATESAYGRELGYQQQQAGEAITAGRAAGSGGILNMAALRALTETTDKSLKDLEQRKQELILQNDAAAASKISDLQLKALEFQQQAQQQTFSNLLGMANLGVQTMTEERLAKSQTFQEESAMNTIKLQYGVGGNNMNDVINNAMIFAGDEAKARLAKMQSEIKYTNAQTAKVLAGDSKNAVVNSNVISKLASTYNSLNAKTNKTQQDTDELNNIIGSVSNNATNLNSFYEAVANDAKGTAQAQVAAIEAAKKPTSKIETDISNFGKFLDPSMKREQLRKKGYSQSEIANSSVGNIAEKGISLFQSFFR